MINMLRIFLFLLISVIGSVAFGQSNELSKEEAAEDIEVAIAAIENCHPGLEIYLTNSEVQSIYSELGVGVEEGISLDEFHRLILASVTKIKDGHTDLLEGKRYSEAYPYQDKILPFKYRILDGKVFIAKSMKEGAEVQDYSEIKSINGVEINQVLKVLEMMTPADGGNIGFKHAYNEKVFGRQFAKFFGAANTYELKILTPEGSTQNRIVVAVHDSVAHFEGDQGAPLELEINRSGNYAILTINTFQYQLIRRSGLDYQAFLKSSFKKLKKEQIGNLVIDLRENYGGDNILGLTLYSFLTEGPFKWMNPSETRLIGTNKVSEYSNYPEGNLPFIKTHKVELIDSTLHSVFDGIDSRESHNSNLMFKGPGARPENISKYIYKGDVYVLTSGMTFSAAAILSAKLYDSGRAVFVGEKTGGSASEFCGGGFYKVTLPNSKFVLQIPFMKRSVSLNSDDIHAGGTIPHHVINPTIETMRNGSDSVLEKALELIGERTDR